jgi:hypothetical protein
MCKLNISIVIIPANDQISETGEVTPIEGKTYTVKDATTSGKAFKQEAVRSLHRS